jgi:hypothetical protein
MLDNMRLKKEDLIKKVDIGRPHIVLLGAGASRASFINGDKNGLKIPLMNDLFDVLNLWRDLEKYNLDIKNRNFEDFFSDLYKENVEHPLIKIIETRIFDFFNKLKLPDIPTIYDYLVLSLRKKDVIATFNWDPFLWAAARRNYGVVDLPHLIFLHGNVSVGYCHKCKIKGENNYTCSRCGDLYIPSKLLYPVKYKDYNIDPGIKGEWQTLKNVIKHAYIFSVFGYSAPKTDVEAMKILDEAWGGADNRNFEQIEFIHKPGSVEEDVMRPWKKFVHSHHYDITNNFFNSIISRFPRRTCEALWSMTMEAKFTDSNSAPQNISLSELQEWFKRFSKYEK